MIESGDESAYGQLFENLHPVILHEAEMYRGRLEYYSTEDFIQEGYILIWETICKGNYRASRARFSTYFGVAYRRELIKIYRKYCTKNAICTSEHEDYRGTIIRTYAESEYIKKVRAQNAARQRRYMERKRAALACAPAL